MFQLNEYKSLTDLDRELKEQGLEVLITAVTANHTYDFGHNDVNISIEGTVVHHTPIVEDEHVQSVKDIFTQWEESMKPFEGDNNG